MLGRRKKILCYVMVFDQIDIIKHSLDFLTTKANFLDIVVLENPSPNTDQIKKLINRYGKNKLIKRYYLFEQNITGNAFGVVLTTELQRLKKSHYVLVTDGDLVSEDSGWLDEEINILKRHKEVFTCGLSLDMKNLPLKSFPDAKSWIPPDINSYNDFYEAYTGAHLLLVRGTELYEFIKWRNENDLDFVDGELHRFCYEVLGKKWSRTKKSKAYHLTWDLYHDKENPYTKMKTEQNFHDTWYHNRQASYKLTEY